MHSLVSRKVAANLGPEIKILKYNYNRLVSASTLPAIIGLGDLFGDSANFLIFYSISMPLYLTNIYFLQPILACKWTNILSFKKKIMVKNTS